MIWFTSDWHLGHANIAGPSVSNWKSGFRDFPGVHEMNNTLITNINKYVAVEDTIYFLGDFCFGGHSKTPNFRDQINCQNIHVIRGNHDQHIDKYKDKFLSIQDVLSITVDKQTFFLSHYAHRVWYGSHKGFIHLYGHSHNSIPDFGKSMDVGIDAAYWLFKEYRPFSITEILGIMEFKEVTLVDHHSPNTNFK